MLHLLHGSKCLHVLYITSQFDVHLLCCFEARKYSTRVDVFPAIK